MIPIQPSVKFCRLVKRVENDENCLGQGRKHCGKKE